MPQQYPTPELLSQWRNDLLAYARSPWPRAYEADFYYRPKGDEMGPAEAAIAAKCSETLYTFTSELVKLTTPHKVDVLPTSRFDNGMPAAFVRFEDEHGLYFDIELNAWHGDPLPRLRFEIELNYMGQLPLMTDEFWRALLEAQRWAVLEFRWENNVTEPNRLIWPMVTAWQTVDAREKATQNPIDGFEDVLFNLSADLPLSDDCFASSLEVFKRFYRVGYLLYRAEHSATKGIPTDAGTVETVLPSS